MRLLSYLKTLAMFCLFVFLFFSTSARAEKDNRPSKNVLLLVSYDMVHPWTEMFVSALMEQAKHLHYNVKFDVLELNTLRSADVNEYQRHLATRFPKISNGFYDAIVTLDDPALDLLLANNAQLKNSIPVVFAGYEKDTTSLRNLYKNLTGIRQVGSPEKTILQGLKFYPNTKNFLVVCDSSESSKLFEQDISSLKIFGVEIQTINTQHHTISQICDKITNLPDDTLVMICPWRGVRENDYQSTPALAMDIGRISKNPYFITDISMLGFGALGGWVVDPIEHGKDIVWFLEKALAKENCADIEFMSTKARPFFDWNVLSQYDLPENKLPPYSHIKNRPISYWSHYKAQIIFCLSVVFVIIGALFLLMYLLLKSSRKTMELVKSYPGRIGVFDKKGHIIYISSENSPVDHFAKHLRDLPTINYELFSEEAKKSFETGQSRSFEYETNGESRLVIIQPLSKKHFGKPTAMWVSTDITELNNLYKTQRAMTACLEYIFSKDRLQGSVSFALDTLGEQTKADRCVIFKLDETHHYLTSHSEYVSNGSAKLFDGIELPADEIYIEDENAWTAYENLPEQINSFGAKWRAILSENKTSAMYVDKISIKGTHWGYIVLFYENDIPNDACKQTMRDFSRFIEVILEREFSQTQILSALQQAREANKAKSYFIASVSHEIRTPLNTVIGLSELLRTAEVSAEEQKQYLESIVYGGNALLQLINDVLDLSKLEAGQMNITAELGAFGEIANNVERLFSHKATEKNISMQVDVPSDLPMLVFDKMRIRQILLNLVGNAVKFTSKGTIKVWAKFEKIDNEFGEFTFAVSDTGKGIAPEDVSKLMNPFVQLGSARDSDNVNRGTGLGLAISKRLAEKMGGELWVESQKNKGSTFGVSIKHIRYSQAPKIEVKAESGVVLAKAEKDISLLIVDDVDMNRKVLKAMCAKMGVADICIVASGREALEVLKTRKFSLVLTDIWMPEMSGEELAMEIRKDKTFDDIPIIAITADIEARGNFDTTLFSGILLKPITIAKINKIISFALDTNNIDVINELEK